MNIGRKILTAGSVYRNSGWNGIRNTAKRNYWLNSPLLRFDGRWYDVRGMSGDGRLAMMQGTYERAEIDAVAEIDSELPVIEFGGCLGIVSCRINERLKNPKHQLVVEANPRMIPTLKSNRRLHQAKFSIIPMAIAYGSDHVEFVMSDDPLASGVTSVSGAGDSILVPTTDLSKLAQQYGFGKFTFVCDIEGMEVEVFQRELELIERCVPLIVLETHPSIVGENVVREMLDHFENHRFTVERRSDQVVVLRNLSM